jgi:hypothetical protein
VDDGYGDLSVGLVVGIGGFVERDDAFLPRPRILCAGAQAPQFFSAPFAGLKPGTFSLSVASRQTGKDLAR